MTSPKKVQDDFMRMQLREQAIQRDMQHMMHDMFNSFYYPASFIMPVLVVPEQRLQTKAVKPAQQKTDTKTTPAKATSATPAPSGKN